MSSLDLMRSVAREPSPGPTPEPIVQGGIVILIALLGIAFAAGYVTRELKSRQRREQARRWREYTEPDWLRASAPANTNELPAAPVGELGQMLDRWESRARARRTG